MPYTQEQQKTARALEHGWVPPKGAGLEGFRRTVKSGAGKGMSFASLVVKESDKKKKRKKAAQKYGLSA